MTDARTAIATAAERFAFSPTARLDAELLLAHALGIERNALLLDLTRPVPDSFWPLAERRALAAPGAGVLGRKSEMITLCEVKCSVSWAMVDTSAWRTGIHAPPKRSVWATARVRVHSPGHPAGRAESDFGATFDRRVGEAFLGAVEHRSDQASRHRIFFGYYR